LTADDLLDPHAFDGPDVCVVVYSVRRQLISAVALQEKVAFRPLQENIAVWSLYAQIFPLTEDRGSEK
jgi:hypothetical protein